MRQRSKSKPRRILDYENKNTLLKCGKVAEALPHPFVRNQAFPPAENSFQKRRSTLKTPPHI